MKKTAILSLVCLAISTTLSGCDNSKAANKENFAKVVREDIAKNPYRLPSQSFFNNRNCTLSLGKIPQEIVSFDPSTADFAESHSNKNKALTNAGILTSSVVKEEEIKSDYYGVKKQITTKYDLSEKGKQLAKQDNNGNFYIPYCQVAFKEVKLFTEPADAAGAKVSYVDYTYAIEKVDDWINNPEILRAYPEAKRILDSVSKPLNAKKPLILTNEGWSTGEN